MPRTSVKIWQRFAPSRAASATAVVSVPPRPSVVISSSPIACGAEPLEAGDDDDLAVLELLVDAARLDVRDARLAVAAVGGDARLRAGEADRRNAERVQRHRDERGALVLAGGEQHVELAQVGLLGDGRGESHELVGRVAHRRNRDDEVVAGRALARDPPGDTLDAVGTGQRRTAELLHDEGGCHIRRILAVGPGLSERGPGAGGPGMRSADVTTAARSLRGQAIHPAHGSTAETVERRDSIRSGA